jgi:hypothetical protein
MRLGLAAALCGLLTLTARPHEPVTTSVTFNQEVVRILERHCLGCHSARGVARDIPLTTFEEARPWAKAIKEEILEKRMPPFQAVKGFGDFHRSYALAQRDAELIVSWVEGGAPKGEEKDYPQSLGAAKDWPLGTPDLVLQPAAEAVIAAGEGFEERCFTMPTRTGNSHWVSAVDFRPGNGAVVHSASFAVETAGAAAKECGGGNGLSLGHWVPGQAAVRLPAGTGRALPAGARVAMKIRYRRTSEAARDRSTLALYYTDRFTRREAVRPVGTLEVSGEATLPANAARLRLKAAVPIEEATDIIAVRPIFSPLVRSIEVAAHRPDGTAEVLALVKDYRHDWNPTYYLRTPAALAARSRVVVTAYLDNSEQNPRLSGGAKARTFVGELCELLYAPSQDRARQGAAPVNSGAARRP